MNVQQDNNRKLMADITEWLLDKSVNILERLSQSLDWNLLEHLWGDLKIAVYRGL